MPQLNPSPWFLILLFSWLTFLLVVHPKILSHKNNNLPTYQSENKLSMAPWNWPWF